MSSLPLQAKRSKGIMVHHVWSKPTGGCDSGGMEPDVILKIV